MTLDVFWHEDVLAHDTGEGVFEAAASPLMAVPEAHPEGPVRIRNMKSILERGPLAGHLRWRAGRHATRAELELVHEPAYVDEIERLSAAGGGQVTSTTVAAGGTLAAATAAAGTAVAALEAVLGGDARVAYALVRPPGHHAQPAQADGYCFFNSVAIAAATARRSGVERVAIVDWDVHHGNGTQECFYERDDVLTVSLHMAHGSWGASHPQTGGPDEVGAGAGAGFNVNVDLPLGTGDEGYAATAREVVGPLLDRFAPDLILVAAGQDPSQFDPNGRQSVSMAGFRELGRAAAGWAERHCGGRLVLVQEGGYAPSYAAWCLHATLEGVLGLEPALPDPLAYLPDDPGRARAAIERTRAALAPYWELRRVPGRGREGLAQRVDVEAVLADLDALAELTGTSAGAQRLAWTEGWLRAREYVAERLEGVAQASEDPAGNRWYTVHGARPEAVVLGSHVDSVPDGGRLDGTLGVLAGVAILRALGGVPPVTVRLVDWADEEGARFGRSCFGSACAAGALRPDDVRDLRDVEGTSLGEALAACGVDLDAAPGAARELATARAYLELHIEQGGVLEGRGDSVGVATGCLGVERHHYVFRGRASHAGTTPMAVRADAFLAAAETALAVRDIATRHGGVGTVGPVRVHPGVATIINGEAAITVDLRAADAGTLASMHREVAAAARAQDGIAVTSSELLRVPPVPFDPDLGRLAEAACLEVAGSAHRLPSGALHDATEIAARVPTALLFAQSVGGVSHSAEEHTEAQDVRVAVRALAALTDRAVADLAQPSG